MSETGIYMQKMRKCFVLNHQNISLHKINANEVNYHLRTQVWHTFQYKILLPFHGFVKMEQQAGFGFHTDSFPICIGDYFSRDKATEPRCSPLTSLTWNLTIRGAIPSVFHRCSWHLA